MQSKLTLPTLHKLRGRALQLCFVSLLLLRESRRAAGSFSSAGVLSSPRRYFVSTTHRFSSARDAITVIKQPIVGYHKDEENHWVAELECGHFQHVRHNPPMTERPWVLTEEGRRSFLGYKLVCKKCFQKAPKDKPN
mmetsp:Transcript_20269/g.29397  ORF Transcript_20269/g.29397 Transcript_20269/m.29397 type:complete len:137 (+) Transcript_20269:69-479(+)